MNIVVVHGGVSGAPKQSLPSLAHSLPPALTAGSALDAVEIAVRALEDDPKLNAGTGSVLNVNGELELDAGIVDGATGRCGGVANVTVRNPISLARHIMEHTPHVLVTGEGARRLGGDSDGLEPTPEQLARWERARAAGHLVPSRFGSSDHVDTVGAVALDPGRRLAAGSSTGGVFGKLVGRVGDAPILGAGMFADDRAAVVGTGVGELFLRTQASLRVAMLIDDGRHPQEACEAVIDFLGKQQPLPAGLLAVDAEGRIGAAYRGEAWAVEGPDGPIRAVRLD